jgi:hypothetical protein
VSPLNQTVRKDNQTVRKDREGEPAAEAVETVRREAGMSGPHDRVET